MKAKISELMDGELPGQEATRALTGLRDEGEGRDAWRTYHLIGDALRDTRMLSPRFAERMAARLAEEPTVLAPAAKETASATWRRGALLPLAASVAGVALVGALWYLPGSDAPAPAPQVATAAPQVQPVAVAPESASVPLPSAADDYLLAHQAYSRNLLQGMAPYVRTVSGRSAENKR